MAFASLVGFSAVFATAEGIKQSQQKSRREEHRTRKNNLIVHCCKSSEYSAVLEGRRVVLAGGKLYIDTGSSWNGEFGHPFEGYYLPYPDPKTSGLVSTVTNVAPIMNWVYVDKETFRVKFGRKDAADGNLVGPWDCTRQDRRLTFQQWEGFYAVPENGVWSIYFDVNDDGLKGKVEEGIPILEIELFRKEMRVRKPQYVDPAGKTEDEAPRTQNGSGPHGANGGVVDQTVQKEAAAAAVQKTTSESTGKEGREANAGEFSVRTTAAPAAAAETETQEKGGAEGETQDSMPVDNAEADLGDKVEGLGIDDTASYGNVSAGVADDRADLPESPSLD